MNAKGNLTDAVKKGDVNQMKTLIASGANPNVKDEDGKTAFDYAKSPEEKSLLSAYRDAEKEFKANSFKDMGGSIEYYTTSYNRDENKSVEEQILSDLERITSNLVKTPEIQTLLSQLNTVENVEKIKLSFIEEFI